MTTSGHPVAAHINHYFGAFILLFLRRVSAKPHDGHLPEDLTKRFIFSSAATTCSSLMSFFSSFMLCAFMLICAFIIATLISATFIVRWHACARKLRPYEKWKLPPGRGLLLLSFNTSFETSVGIESSIILCHDDLKHIR